MKIDPDLLDVPPDYDARPEVKLAPDVIANAVALMEAKCRRAAALSEAIEKGRAAVLAESLEKAR